MKFIFHEKRKEFIRTSIESKPMHSHAFGDTGLVDRGYDTDAYDPGPDFDAALGNAPGSVNRDNSNGSRGAIGYTPSGDFQTGYIQSDGQAHAFDLRNDDHFNQFQNRAGYGAGEWGTDKTQATR